MYTYIPSSLFPFDVPTKIIYAFNTSPLSDVHTVFIFTFFFGRLLHDTFSVTRLFIPLMIG